MVIARRHEVKFLTKIRKRIEFSKMEEDLVPEQHQDDKLKAKEDAW
jgi:hypothetical protein